MASARANFATSARENSPEALPLEHLSYKWSQCWIRRVAAAVGGRVSNLVYNYVLVSDHFPRLQAFQTGASKP
jgi:hypothetical protein